MTILWVKFQYYNATEVPSEGCLNVNQFLEACQKKLSPLLDTYAAAQLSLSTTRGGSFLRPGLSLLDIPLQSGYSANNDENPLFLFVVGGSSAQGKGYYNSLVKKDELCFPEKKCFE